MRRPIPYLLLLAGCVEYGVEKGAGDPVDPFDSGGGVNQGDSGDSGDSGETGDSGDSGNAGDSGDSGDSGVEVRECSLVPAAARTVPVLDVCDGAAVPPVTDPWNLDLEWEYVHGSVGVYGLPVVGPFVDTDGDGDVDADDTPVIAFGEQSGELTVMDGTGGIVMSLSGFGGYDGVTIADVTGDGAPEVIALSSTGAIKAIAPDRTVLWQSAVSDVCYQTRLPQVTVADLDNDGRAEIVYDTVVLDGPTGTRLALLSTSPPWGTRAPVVADLDLDGTREILLGTETYAPDGTVLWSNDGVGMADFAAVADLDGDPEGEVVVVSGSNFYVYDSDGTRLYVVKLDGAGGGPPALADFDGDGMVEVAVATNKSVGVYEVDGTPVWTERVDNNGGFGGCSGFDGDADGVYEVLFADERAFRIYDGRDGWVLYESTHHDSGNLLQYPVVADVDGDGSAEIVVSTSYNHGGPQGITVFGNVVDGLPTAGVNWNAHDYAISNLPPDGSVPTGEAPSWHGENVFRARPAVEGSARADVFVELDELCITTCAEGGQVEVTWQAGNQGAATSPALTAILYGLVGGSEVQLARATVPAMAPGEVPEGGKFVVDAAAAAGAEAYGVRLEDLGAPECDFGNQDARDETAICP